MDEKASNIKVGLGSPPKKKKIRIQYVRLNKVGVLSMYSVARRLSHKRNAIGQNNRVDTIRGFDLSHIRVRKQKKNNLTQLLYFGWMWQG